MTTVPELKYIEDHPECIGYWKPKIYFAKARPLNSSRFSHSEIGIEMIYQINIKGELDQSWSDWLGEVEITSKGTIDGSVSTTLTVDVEDQSILFGILDRIRDLNLVLINVINVDAVEKQ